jgi:hypothetical protein
LKQDREDCSRSEPVFGEMQHVGEERSVALRVMVIGHEWIFSLRP